MNFRAPRPHELVIGFALILAVTFAFFMREPAAEPPPAQPQGRLVAEPLKIIVFGDSLAAGHRISREMAFPARLEGALEEEGYSVNVVNAGISGDTTAGGLTRLPAVLEQKPHLVILELGANDMLRGAPPEAMRENLDTMLSVLVARGVYVLLVGMHIPAAAAHGQDYSNIYESLARKHRVTLYPFFLEGIAQNPQFNLPDGIHPNEAGVEVMVKNILPTVKAMLSQLAEATAP